MLLMICMIFLLAALITAMLYIVMVLLLFNKNQEMEFKSNFECGFNSKNKYNNSFSVNYFFLCVILIVFDLEVIMVFLSVNYQMMALNILGIGMFLAYFTGLLCFEWFNSIMEWK